jgi:hypothetical protein
MAITLAVGTTVAIASAYGPVRSMTALTNASNAVATLEASHGVAVNDYVEITSGWARANGRVARASVVAANDVTLAGIDTQSTARFPSGSGTGSVREVTTWTTIGQITKDISVSGGEQQFADITTLEDVLDKQIPTRRSPVSVQLPLFFDPALSYVAAVRAASDAATPAAVRFIYPNGVILVANAYWSFQDVPTIQDDTLRGQIDLTFLAVPTIYTS